MNNLQTKLIRESFERVSAEELSGSFYSHLFSIQPAMRLVSPEHPFDQKRQLTEMLKSLIESLDDAEQLRAVSESLGRRQALDGMREEHYQTFGTTLISALSESDRSGFTRETESAWKELYELTSNEMKRGARRLSGSTDQINKTTTKENTMNIFTQAKAITTNLILIAIFAASAFAQVSIPNAAPPSNDNFASALDLNNQIQVHRISSNAEATKEAGEPNHAGNAGGSSIWFKWTAPMSRLMQVSTNGGPTNFDTLLNVYKGTLLGNLTSFGTNDDINGAGNRKSHLVFQAAAGTTYYIAVDGKNVGGVPAAGSLQLDIQPFFMYQGADFDADGMTDLTMFRPSTGDWWVDGTTRDSFKHFGSNGDIPLIMARGVNISQTSVFRPSTTTWYIPFGNGSVATVQAGLQGDIPVPENYHATDSDVAVFRPSTGVWYVQGFTDDFIQYKFGLQGDIPVPGQYSPDPYADIAVFRPSNGTWYFNIRSNDNIQGTFKAVRFGQSGDKPVAADYDGDGVLDIAIFRPSTGVWWINLSNGGETIAIKWGIAEDIPTFGDYDGDGAADLAVFRPSTSTWYIRRSLDGQLYTKVWGQPGDIPMTSNRTF